MWKFSLPLRHPETERQLADVGRLEAGLQRKSIDQYMWLLHDRDEGAAPHVQGMVRMQNSRSVAQLSSMLGLPASSIRPLVDRASQHGAFERYCRYLLHESPDARADGKFHYPDGDVRANFDFRGLIDRYFGSQAGMPALTADQIKLKVYRGELTPLEVHASHTAIYVRHHEALETLYAKGRSNRELVAYLAERADLA